MILFIIVIICALVAGYFAESFWEALIAGVVCGMILFLLSPSANAQEAKGLSIVTPAFQVSGAGVHVASHHWPSDEWNNKNPGAYLVGNYTGPGIMAGEYVLGTYYNSERNQSVYLARNFSLFNHVDLAVGAITGYNRAKVMPLVVPSVWFPLVDDWRARIHFLPKVEKSGANVVHLSFERRW